MYEELLGVGFTDEEFPEWWYSPAREVDAGEKTRISVNAPEQTRIDVNKSEQSEGAVDLRAPDPTVEPPMGRRSQRPPLPIQSDSMQSDAPPSTVIHPSSSAFTDEEVNLLASNSVYRSPESGEWFHREEYPDGRLMITPMNPHAEIRRIRESSQDSNVMNKVRDSMMSQLEISTQSIIKKVALNPSVFWTYSYVTSVRDPDEGVLLFDGDLGDFVSFCVKFTGEAYFGVVPTIMTNRPSMLTSLRNSRKNPGGVGPGDRVTVNEITPRRDYE